MLKRGLVIFNVSLPYSFANSACLPCSYDKGLECSTVQIVLFFLIVTEFTARV